MDWALLSLGIDLAGDAHAVMSSRSLIVLGATLGAQYFASPAMKHNMSSAKQASRPC